jgi:hypothetical protein
MLGETEEYEPLSRAAYYHAMRKDQDKNKGNYTFFIKKGNLVINFPFFNDKILNYIFSSFSLPEYRVVLCILQSFFLQ